MRLLWFSLLGVGACGVREHGHDAASIEGLPTQNGSGWGAEAPDAPWEVGEIASALFATSSSGWGDQGILLLSTGDVDCATLLNIYGMWSYEALIGQDSGFLFSVSAARPASGMDFSGLYLGGYGYSNDGGYFGMTAVPFHDGVLWFSGYGTTSWLRVDTDDGVRVIGEYFVQFWAGSFDAAHCGELPGWDSGFY